MLLTDIKNVLVQKIICKILVNWFIINKALIKPATCKICALVFYGRSMYVFFLHTIYAYSERNDIYYRHFEFALVDA